MLLKDLLSPADLVLAFDPPDKWQAIQQLVEHLVQNGRLTPQAGQEAAQQVLERERSMSTGMERGLAIPHAAIEGLPKVLACLGVVLRPEGVNFDSIDVRPAHIIVLLLVPRAQKLLHIRTLAEIARVLGKESVRDRLRQANGAEAAWNALVSGDAAHPA